MGQPPPQQPPPQQPGSGDGWTTARLALLGAGILVALLVGLLIGNMTSGDSNSGGTTVISKRNDHTVTQSATSTVTSPPTTVTTTDTETETTTATS